MQEGEKVNKLVDQVEAGEREKKYELEWERDRGKREKREKKRESVSIDRSNNLHNMYIVFDRFVGCLQDVTVQHVIDKISIRVPSDTDHGLAEISQTATDGTERLHRLDLCKRERENICMKNMYTERTKKRTKKLAEVSARAVAIHLPVV